MNEPHSTYEQINFDEVRVIIKKITGYHGELDFELVPDEIAKIVDMTGVRVEWKALKLWNRLENGIIEIDLQELLEWSDYTLSSGDDIIILTDECFLTRQAYKIKLDQLEIFETEIYPSIHDMGLVQPFDMILLQIKSKTLIMIHHEGYVATYNSTNP